MTCDKGLFVSTYLFNAVPCSMHCAVRESTYFKKQAKLTVGVCHRAGIKIVHIHLSHMHAGSFIQCVPSSITSTHRTEAKLPIVKLERKRLYASDNCSNIHVYNTVCPT